MKTLWRVLLPLLIVGGAFFYFQQARPEDPPTRSGPPRALILPVEALPLTRSQAPLTIQTQGIVRPHHETALTSRLSGRVIALSPLFEAGAFFQKGDLLLELDPTDFVSALARAEANLARAQATLAQEEARAQQALLDWRDLGYREKPSDLVLRKPQLKEARAAVKAAESELTDAQHNLERTKVRAPYAGRVRQRNVGLGQSVSPNTTLGTLFSTDFAEVRLPLSARQYTHLQLPDQAGDPPLPVTLSDALGEERPTSWPARIVRSEGALDEQSRKLFVIARLEDPFGLKKNHPPLRIGQPVRATIEGSPFEGVYQIPREALVGPLEVLLVEDTTSTLTRRTLKPIWSDEEHLIVREGLPDHHHLVLRGAGLAPEGAEVKILPPGGLQEPSTSSSPTDIPRRKRPPAH